MSLKEESNISYVIVPSDRCLDPLSCERRNMAAMEEKVGELLTRLSFEADSTDQDISSGLDMRVVARCKRIGIFARAACQPTVDIQLVNKKQDW